jgi:periplasmic divalent cation tolerance protein
MSGEALVVFATFPDAECARRIVTQLVEEKLAACGNIVPAVESIFRWEGKVENASEAMAILKTDYGHFHALQTRLTELHPYDVPECLALRIADGPAKYLRWLGDALG